MTDADVSAFGSFAAGLNTVSSDLDISLKFPQVYHHSTDVNWRRLQNRNLIKLQRYARSLPTILKNVTIKSMTLAKIYRRL